MKNVLVNIFAWTLIHMYTTKLEEETIKKQSKKKKKHQYCGNSKDLRFSFF